MLDCGILINDLDQPEFVCAFPVSTSILEAEFRSETGKT
jgi:hypothetical protein